MSEPAIIAKDVRVVFPFYSNRAPSERRRFRVGRRQRREVVALDEVSLTVEQGEALGVIGQNGSGKTTLMRALAGTLVPDGGTVEWRTERPTLLELGVGFNTALTGRNNVILGGLAAGHSRTTMEELFDDIVEFSGIGDAIDRPVATYSSGMRSRLSFAIAMTLKPKVVLLDELLTVGDASFKEKSAAAMSELLEGAGTVVIVSHSMARVREQCDRVLWLDSGKVMMVGDSDEVVDAYLSFIRDQPTTAEKPVEEWDGQDRARVVKRLLMGEPVMSVAAETGVSKDELREWRRIFLQGGKDALQERAVEHEL